MAGPHSAAAGRIFISYRRDEAAYPAGWLYDRITDHLGRDQVFKDVDSIQLGDDFAEVITRAVSSCDVLLAVIGTHWLTATDETGRRRLDDPTDFVRLEIEAALARGVRVIPILIDGAKMPGAAQLPESLAHLARRQALELSPSRFDYDTGQLIRVLDRTIAEVRREQNPRTATAKRDAEPNSTGQRPKSRPSLAGSPKPPTPRLRPKPVLSDAGNSRRIPSTRRSLTVKALLAAVAAAAVIAATVFAASLLRDGVHTPPKGPTTPTGTTHTTTTETTTAPVALPRSATALADDLLVVPLDVGGSKTTDLYAVDTNGKLGDRLTRASGTDTFPAISPDRRTVGYVRLPTQTLAFAAADGSGEPLVFTPQPAACRKVWRPSWRPDGKALALACVGPGAEQGLYVLDLSGRLITRLPTPAKVDDPAWSPDGTTVAYWAKPGGVPQSLFLVNADGKSEPRMLTSAQGGADADPTWSPDGKRIAYRHFGTRNNSDILVVNVDGSNRHAITTTGNAHDPTWSPDGTQIAYKSTGDENSLWVMDADGANQRLILRDLGENWAPAWTGR